MSALRRTLSLAGERESDPAMPRDTPPWHPVLAAVEGPPATWRLIDDCGRHYGTVTLRRVSPTEVRYRAEHEGELIGWATTLRLACERIHGAYLRDMSPGGPPRADWGGTPWQRQYPDALR